MTRWRGRALGRRLGAPMRDGRFQTARLARGRHRDAREGVCAMELSSLLADERFTDHPQTVCPAVAAFLRGYNDALSDRRRQELFGLAAAVVGSRTADAAVRAARAEALHDWSVEVWRARRWRLPYEPFFAPRNGFGDLEAAGAYVGRCARRSRAVHEGTLAFVESLVASAAAAAEPHRQRGALAGLGAGVEPLADRRDERQAQA